MSVLTQPRRMWFELKPLALFAVRTRSVYLAADGLGSGSELPIASFGPHMSKGAELRRARTALEVGPRRPCAICPYHTGESRAFDPIPAL